MYHGHVSIPDCTISILWNLHNNPCHPSEQRVEPQVTVPVTPQERQITSCRARASKHAYPPHKHCKACANHAHAPRPRACTGLHDFHLVESSYQPVPVNITSCNNRVTVPVTPQDRQITSCRARAGQHARPPHKHCKPCAKHAHVPRPRTVPVCKISILWNLHTNPCQ